MTPDASTRKDLDVGFVNGQLIDGTGSPPRRADVGAKDGRIACVGVLSPERAAHVVDLGGLVLCPGFIDMHAHSELVLMVDPHHAPKVTQGVTTEVLGQDGLSYAPVANTAVMTTMRTQLAGWHGNPPGLDWSWRTVSELLERLDHRGVNVAYLAPHGTIRANVMGLSDRPPTGGELAAMCEQVGQSMADGAFGMSAGLTYVPGMYAQTDELIELCRVVARADGYFSPHHRNYGSSTFEAYAECIEIARRSGVALHLTHAMLNRPPNRGRAHELLAMIENARADGIALSLDSYPYTAGCTYLHALLPTWAQESGPDATQERLRKKPSRAEIRLDLEHRGSDGNHGCVVDWDAVVVNGVGAPGYADVIGVSIRKAASARGVEPFDLFVEILLGSELSATCLIFAGDEANVRAIMTDRHHAASSDSMLTGDRPHPRGWGTFSRYLGRYWRELQLLPLEEWIRKFTSLPAALLGLADRGIVREGYAADLVCFDPDTVRDAASFESPVAQSEGIPHVMVNGQFVVFDGAMTGNLPGRAFRSGDGNGQC